MLHTYNGISLSHEKNEILPVAATWMDLEGIMLSEINQRERKTYGFTFKWNIRNKPQRITDTN